MRDFILGLGGDVSFFLDPIEFIRLAPGIYFNLVIVDADALAGDVKIFLQDLLLANGLLHTSVISDMDEVDLMEHCRGLGVLCAVPASPGWQDGAEVMNRLCLFYDME